MTNNARELVSLVLVEAVGSSITPFVPLPFVDDYLFAHLLRRITRKVTERAGRPIEEHLAKAIVDSYVQAGDPGVGAKVVSAAARFAVRKVGVVLDVKRSHDAFGQSLAYALALDVSFGLRVPSPATAQATGEAIYWATQSVGSAALEVISRAGRKAWSTSPQTSTLAHVAEALALQLDDIHARLDHRLRWELGQGAGSIPSVS